MVPCLDAVCIDRCGMLKIEHNARSGKARFARLVNEAKAVIKAGNAVGVKTSRNQCREKCAALQQLIVDSNSENYCKGNGIPERGGSGGASAPP